MSFQKNCACLFDGSRKTLIDCERSGIIHLLSISTDVPGQPLSIPSRSDGACSLNETGRVQNPNERGKKYQARGSCKVTGQMQRQVVYIQWNILLFYPPHGFAGQLIIPVLATVLGIVE